MGIMTTSRRVSDFIGSLMKKRMKFSVRGVDVISATGRRVIDSEGYHIFGCCQSGHVRIYT